MYILLHLMLCFGMEQICKSHTFLFQILMFQMHKVEFSTWNVLSIALRRTIEW